MLSLLLDCSSPFTTFAQIKCEFREVIWFRFCNCDYFILQIYYIRRLCFKLKVRKSQTKEVFSQRQTIWVWRRQKTQVRHHFVILYTTLFLFYEISFRNICSFEKMKLILSWKKKLEIYYINIIKYLKRLMNEDDRMLYFTLLVIQLVTLDQLSIYLFFVDTGSNRIE